MDADRVKKIARQMTSRIRLRRVSPGFYEGYAKVPVEDMNGALSYERLRLVLGIQEKNSRGHKPEWYFTIEKVEDDATDVYRTKRDAVEALGIAVKMGYRYYRGLGWATRT